MSIKIPDNLPKHKAEWLRYAERSNSAMLWLMAWISLRFGRTPARFILLGISLYFLIFATAARRASNAYLTRVLGRSPKFIEIFRHFHSFASTIHDRVFLLNERFDLFQFEVHGAEIIDEVLAAGQGALLMGAHFGSFEALRAIGCHRANLKIAMLMYEANAIKINSVLSSINPSAKYDIVPLGRVDSMLRVQTCLDSGMVLGILGDRALNDDKTQSVLFFGEKANFPIGSMRLAALFKKPVLFMCGIYLGTNRYAIHFEKLADFREVERQTRAEVIHNAVIAYAACLERHCLTAPYNWFNFFNFWHQRTT